MGSLLIKPVQRIMKYPLLLGELWQATPEDHPDFRPLQEAFTAAKIINVTINEFKRRKDIGETLLLLSVSYFATCDFHEIQSGQRMSFYILSFYLHSASMVFIYSQS